jgi:hypothetical protein
MRYNHRWNGMMTFGSSGTHLTGSLLSWRPLRM